MEAAHYQIGDVAILRLRGKLELGEITWLKDLVAQAISWGICKILLDFSNVRTIDESCIRELKPLEEKLRNTGKGLKLLHVGKTKGFSATTLAEFEVCDDEEEAIRNFNVK